jgi:two-component system sensor histidine kinase KdpD
MVYLVGIMVSALWLGRGPAILGVVLSVALFDFCFVPPQWTFAVAETEYIFTFLVMLGTGLLISHLASLVGLQAEAARNREHRTAALYALSRELAIVEDIQEIVHVITRNASEAFAAQVSLHLADPQGRLVLRGASPGGFQPPERDYAVAQWVLTHGQKAGLGTGTLTGTDMLFVPLAVSQKTLGVLGILPQGKNQLADPEQVRLLEASAGQAAAALERAHLAHEAEQVRLQVEAERMRNSLLSAVSHDLRTPLAAIAGASSTLLEGDGFIDGATRRELLQTVYDESDRLSHLVGNLLEATRLEGGALTLRREWQSLEEIVGAVLHRMNTLLRHHTVDVQLSPHLPLVLADGALLQEVFANLLDNARKYTPAGTTIEVTAIRQEEEVLVEIADRGPGFPAGSEGKLFEKFYRLESTRHRSGVGLGLTICKGIVELHGGRISASNREGGGAVFRFSLPRGGDPPNLSEAEAAA